MFLKQTGSTEMNTITKQVFCRCVDISSNAHSNLTKQGLGPSPGSCEARELVTQPIQGSQLQLMKPLVPTAFWTLKVL